VATLNLHIRDMEKRFDDRLGDLISTLGASVSGHRAFLHCVNLVQKSKAGQCRFQTITDFLALRNSKQSLPFLTKKVKQSLSLYFAPKTRQIP
jgi:ABC-type histidine transport system ATPase subunit